MSAFPNKQVSIFISVPEAESLVEKFRLQFDPYRRRGVPAHITLIGPFTEPVDADFRQDLREFLQHVQPFDFRLTSVQKFKQQGVTEVVYLAPESANQFTNLRTDICSRYRLAVDNVYPYVPHVTVGVHERVESFGATAKELEELALQLSMSNTLPVYSQAHEAVLMQETTEPNSFCVLGRYTIGANS
jgi:2'-5' RNA ligase